MLARQVLRAMPVQWGLLKQSGVAATVRQRGAEHPNRAVRAAVAAVTQHWANAVGDASLATALPQAAAPASAAPARRDALTPSPSEEAAEVLDEGVRLRLAEADAVRHGWAAHLLLLLCCKSIPCHMLCSSPYTTPNHVVCVFVPPMRCIWFIFHRRCTIGIQSFATVSALHVRQGYGCSEMSLCRQRRRRRC